MFLLDLKFTLKSFLRLSFAGSDFQPTTQQVDYHYDPCCRSYYQDSKGGSQAVQGGGRDGWSGQTSAVNFNGDIFKQLCHVQNDVYVTLVRLEPKLQE